MGPCYCNSETEQQHKNKRSVFLCLRERQLLVFRAESKVRSMLPIYYTVFSLYKLQSFRVLLASKTTRSGRREIFVTTRIYLSKIPAILWSDFLPRTQRNFSRLYLLFLLVSIYEISNSF